MPRSVDEHKLKAGVETGHVSGVPPAFSGTGEPVKEHQRRPVPLDFVVDA
jgi:hypothetical protein